MPAKGGSKETKVDPEGSSDDLGRSPRRMAGSGPEMLKADQEGVGIARCSPEDCREAKSLLVRADGGGGLGWFGL